MAEYKITWMLHTSPAPAYLFLESIHSKRWSRVQWDEASSLWMHTTERCRVDKDKKTQLTWTGVLWGLLGSCKHAGYRLEKLNQNQRQAVIKLLKVSSHCPGDWNYSWLLSDDQVTFSDLEATTRALPATFTRNGWSWHCWHLSLSAGTLQHRPASLSYTPRVFCNTP